MEHGDLYIQYDLNTVYNGSVGNKAVAKNAIPEYICPSNPTRPSSGRDANGYGYCDYMPIAYVDINTAAAAVLIRDDHGPSRVAGALALKSTVALDSITRPAPGQPGPDGP